MASPAPHGLLRRTPASYALAVLMALHGARPGRVNADGELMSLFAQDRGRWDREPIAGFKLLELSAAGPKLTEYQVEAAIASQGASDADGRETDWKQIVALYDALIGDRYSLATGPVTGQASW